MKHALKKPDQTAIPLEVLPASSLLAGTSPTAVLSTGEASAIEAIETAWQDAARLAGLVKNYARAGTAAKALCGLRLRALREYYFGPRSAKGGRPMKTGHLAGFPWESMIESRLGIPTRTAKTWMRLADAVEKIAAQQGLDLRSTCEKLPWDWTPEEQAAIEATVNKLTDLPWIAPELIRPGKFTDSAV